MHVHLWPSSMDWRHVPEEAVGGQHVLPLVEHVDPQAKGNPPEHYRDGASSPEKSGLQTDNSLSKHVTLISKRIRSHVHQGDQSSRKLTRLSTSWMSGILTNSFGYPTILMRSQIS